MLNNSVYKILKYLVIQNIGVYVSLGVLISLDVVSIETLDLDTGKK
jgi:hypothetical protein